MTFLIHTYGCQMNVRDTEAVTALLVAAGHTPVALEAEADAIIVNSCSVRGKAEDKAIGKLRQLAAGKRKHPGRIVGAMGCMSQRLGPELFKLVPRLDFAAGTRSERHMPRLVAAAAAGAGRQLALGTVDDPEVPHLHQPGSMSAYVTVLLGCNRRCSYCIVPDVRGPEYSRPPSEILDEARALIAAGTSEITLLGQSVLNYGRTRDVWQGAPPSAGGYREPFPRLLEAVSALPGLRRLRFTSGHPSGCTEQLARAMRELPCVCAHLHLPVQSGSDRILGLMRRGYKAEDYVAAVARLRAAVPDCAITSDTIVGFPTETEADFEATRALMARVGFDNTFIFKYSPRPGTPAAEMADDVPAEVKEHRNRVLLEDQDRIGLALNEAWVGRVAEVLTEGPSLRNAARWAGRSSQNKIVIFAPRPGMAVNDLARVRVTRAKPQTLYGKLVEQGA
ncbi:MAG: tRNA (N6-isopentenyl adenosine(37)-C2)-methylthiotransferase MiaB [Kiritimatiellae bacterium]|nr:tRNA (N6-isopentenyl adenosine(37)-C2)-methylthiotransferase MiaB [Kiritimatiellia bacterium]